MMRKEEIAVYYDLLGLKCEAVSGTLFARKLTDADWFRNRRKD